LRERDYPLLAPSPMAERLRKIAELFPPNSGSVPHLLQTANKQGWPGYFCIGHTLRWSLTQ
jgi:hypothetical protein